MGTLNHGAGNYRTVHEHVLQIHKTAVIHWLCEVITIVKMNDSLFVCLYDVLRKHQSFCQISADLTCDVISHHRIDGRVLVAVLLQDLLILIIDEGHHLAVCGVAGSLGFPVIPVMGVSLRHMESSCLHDFQFH